MKQKFYGSVNKRHDDYMDDEDYEWENADKVFWDEEGYDSKWHLPLYKIGEEHESRTAVNNRSPTVLSNRSPTHESPSDSLLNLLNDEPIPTLFDTQERLTLVDDDTIPTLVDYDTHERPTLVDDTPLKKQRIDHFQKGGKKRTNTKRRDTNEQIQNEQIQNEQIQNEEIQNEQIQIKVENLRNKSQYNQNLGIFKAALLQNIFI
jgi:hypothetical protein